MHVYELNHETQEELEKIQNNLLLEVKNLSLTIERFGKGWTRERLYVIRDFHLKIHHGEVVAIVGASGSGKSLLADAILGIHPKNSIVDGMIKYENELLTEKRRKRLRGNDILLIPQMTNALDPLMKVGKQVKTLMKQNNHQKAVKQIFQKVGLDPDVYHQIPSACSGGMIRKIFIAMALASEAKLIIADEPTNGLDYESIDEMLFQIKMLAKDNKGVIMITHDLEAAMKVADKIAVFYAGETVEVVDKKHLKKGGKFRHPYSRALWNALPQNGFIAIDSSQPSATEKLTGCSFAKQCPKATKKCNMEKPLLKEIGHDEMVRCFYAGM